MHVLLITLIHLAATPVSPPTPGTPLWVTLLSVFAAMFGGTFSWELYKRYRKGGQQDALEVSQAAIEQARSAKDLFVEYRVELEGAQRQVSQYLEQLIKVNRSLGDADARISHLEQELRTCVTGNQEIKSRLEQSKLEREKANQERDRLLIEITKLQTRIQDLEIGERRHE